MARDEKRMGRFQREAEVLASLSHSNVAAIYGLENVGNTRALVLEMVTGETLSDRLGSGPLPVDVALEFAHQIADGLEAAHDRGIIHRDLKPGNIMVTPEGQVKLLDFGLAKPTSADPSSDSSSDLSKSPTVYGGPMTAANVILGTAAYMSPEQARGRVVDIRADVWAFGAVLFEMLTGKQAFGGETTSDTMAAVLRADVDWDALPSRTPVGIRRVLVRCLNKRAKNRYHHIADARLEIEAVIEGDEEAVAAPVRKGALAHEGSRWLPILFFFIAGILVGTNVIWSLVPRTAEAPLRVFDLGAVEPSRFNYFGISPDGRMVVLQLGDSLWVRDLSQKEPRPLPGTEGARMPFWSPGSDHLAFAQDGKLMRLPVEGGPTTAICRLPEGIFLGGTWGPDETIFCTVTIHGLLHVSALGGEPIQVLAPDPTRGELALHYPHFMPDGKTVLSRVRSDNNRYDTIAAWSGGGNEYVMEVPGTNIEFAVYSPSGHLVYMQEQPNPGIWAVPFSASQLEVTGTPFMVAAGGVGPSVAGDNTLVYVSGVEGIGRQLVWVDRAGKALSRIGQPMEEIRSPDLSPDGSMVAAMGTMEGNRDIWLFDVRRGTQTRITVDSRMDGCPTWSPDGSRIAYYNEGDNLIIGSADGGTDPVPFAKGIEVSWSPDGNYLAFSVPDTSISRSVGQIGTHDLWYLDIRDAEKEPVSFLITEASERTPAISPNGRFLAYGSDESGREEIYVRPFPEGEGRWQVSVNGGAYPKWNPRGNELFFVSGDSLMAVSVGYTPEFSPGIPEKLFDAKGSSVDLQEFSEPLYAVGSDGRRLIVVQTAVRGTPRLTAIQNWPKLVE
jgi:serine/threonine-protein kinase